MYMIPSLLGINSLLIVGTLEYLEGKNDQVEILFYLEWDELISKKFSNKEREERQTESEKRMEMAGNIWQVEGGGMHADGSDLGKGWVETEWSAVIGSGEKGQVGS